jgi:hypothetical protein
VWNRSESEDDDDDVVIVAIVVVVVSIVVVVVVAVAVVVLIDSRSTMARVRRDENVPLGWRVDAPPFQPYSVVPRRRRRVRRCRRRGRDRHLSPRRVWSRWSVVVVVLLIL